MPFFPPSLYLFHLLLSFPALCAGGAGATEPLVSSTSSSTALEISTSNALWALEWHTGKPMLNHLFRSLGTALNGAVRFRCINIADPGQLQKTREIRDRFKVMPLPGSIALFNAVPRYSAVSSPLMNPVEASQASLLGYLSAHVKESTVNIENEEDLQEFLAFSRPALMNVEGPHHQRIKHLIVFVKRVSTDVRVSLQLRAIGNLYWDSLRVGVVVLHSHLTGKDRAWLGSLLLRCGSRDPEYDSDMPGGFRQGSRVEVLSGPRHLVGKEGIVIGPRKRDRVDVEFPNQIKPFPVVGLRHIAFHGANSSVCLVSDGASFSEVSSTPVSVKYSDIVARLSKTFGVKPSGSSSAPPLKPTTVRRVPVPLASAGVRVAEGEEEEEDDDMLDEDEDGDGAARWWVGKDDAVCAAGCKGTEFEGVAFDGVARGEPLDSSDLHEHA